MEGVAHHDRAIWLPVVQILGVQDLGASGLGRRKNKGVPE